MGSDRLLTIVKIFIGISIHAPRMGSDRLHSDRLLLRIISIHAPRMGSDFLVDEVLPGDSYISIHAPRMGSDSKNMRFLLCFCNFH